MNGKVIGYRVWFSGSGSGFAYDLFERRPGGIDAPVNEQLIVELYSK